MEVQNRSPSQELSSVSDEQTPRFGYLILLPSHDRTRAVVEVWPDTSVRLPMLAPCPFFYDNNCLSELEDVIESFLGVKVRYVRELWEHDPDDNGKQDCTLWGEKYHFIAVLLVEWAEAPKSIECGRTTIWMSAEEMNNANWFDKEKELELDLKTVVLEAMKEINGEAQAMMSPWRRMGWFSRMTRWVKEVSNCDIGGQDLYRSFNKIVDHHSSVVWRCNLDLSNSKHSLECQPELVYIKATLPLLGEAKRTATIAKVLKELEVVPRLIAVNEKEGMFIQRDGGSMEHEKEINVRLLVETISKMQQLSINRLEELKAVGVKVRDSEWLRANIHELLHHKGLESAVQGNNKYSPMLEDIRRREEEVIEVCEKISRFGFPNTLVHGDVGDQNIGSREKLNGRGYPLYDWGFSHIGHPFVDIRDVEQLTLYREEHCSEQMRREHWVNWTWKLSEEDFSQLVSMVPILKSASMMDLHEREFDIYGAAKSPTLKEFLRYSTEMLWKRMNEFKTERACFEVGKLPSG